MTKFQILNTASELRRAAGWLGRNQKEKIPVVKKIIREANSQKEVHAVLKHFGVAKNMRNGQLLAEALLTSSIRLKNSAHPAHG